METYGPAFLLGWDEYQVRVLAFVSVAIVLEVIGLKIWLCLPIQCRRMSKNQSMESGAQTRRTTSTVHLYYDVALWSNSKEVYAEDLPSLIMEQVEMRIMLERRTRPTGRLACWMSIKGGRGATRVAQQCRCCGIRTKERS